MATGQISTLSDSVTTKRTIASVISMIDPQDTPCVSFFGLANQGRFRFESFPNPKYEWLEDTLRVRTTTLNDATFAASTSATSMDVTDSTIFKPGDVLKINDEKVWVSDVNYATHELTVVRGWGSTTGATSTNGDTVSYLFSARLEGADSDGATYSFPTSPFNYSQIMQWEIEITGSEKEAVSRYGIPDTYKYQLMKALGGMGAGNGQKGRAGDLMIDLEKTFFEGEKIQRAAGVAGAMGGADTFITSHVYPLGGAAMSEDDLLTAVQDTWAAGGKPGVIVCNAFNKRLINSWYAGSVRTERSERTGGVLINQVDTDFGSLDIMLNRWCPADKVYVLQKEYIGWVTLRDWRNVPLAITGDAERHMLLGEFGFVVQNEEAHAIISGTATSA